MKNTARSLFALAALFSLGWFHQATAIQLIGRNVDTNTTVFEDDGLEDDTVGSAPTTANVGSWVVTGSGATVTDSAPAGFIGGNALEIFRGAPQPFVEAQFSSPVAGGDTLEFSFAMNHTTKYPGIIFQNGATEVARIQGDSGGNYRIITEAAGGGGGWENSGITSPLNVWQDLTMTWDTGGGLFRLTADGSSYDYTSTTAAADVDRVLFRTDSGGAIFYLDGDALGPVALATTFTWKDDISGVWNDSGNWTRDGSGGSFPNSNQHTAVFGDAVGSNTRNVFTDVSVTVNSIRFENTMGGNYRIGGGPSINLVATTSASPVPPTIEVSQGTPEFQAPVHLLNDTTANVASGATLIFNNALDLMGNTLTKTGDGTLAIHNDLITSGGTVSLQQGSISGNGTVGGDVNNDGGTISPGNSSGVSGVPEPSGLILMMMALLGVFGVQRWRRTR